MPAPPIPAAPAQGAVPNQHGLLRVVTATQRTAMDTVNQDPPEKEAEMTQLASHIRNRMTEMRNFRNTQGIGERLLEGLRTYKGEYDTTKLNEIRKMKGSEIYARVTATKCRAATALLRDVFLGPERPWDLEPTPVPTVPDSIETAIQELVKTEAATMQQAGQTPDPQAIADRVDSLRIAAEKAAKKKASDEATRAANYVDDLLTEGNFYEALGEFLVDLPIFPFACIKGPVVRQVSQMHWENGKPVKSAKPQMHWYRVSPFDLYWSPGAASVRDAEFVERIRLSRTELASLRDLPGYRKEAINEVLAKFTTQGFREWWDAIDAERAAMEERERWPHSNSTLLDTAEYHGAVSGKMLREWGMSEVDAPDEAEEYRVQAWLIDRYVIKVQIAPSLSQRAPYYLSSFEKVPGMIAGNGLPDILEDVQAVSNATLRALVNNLSISSGPQVVVNDMVLSPGEVDDLYPWKRWHVNFDPMVAGSLKPIDFFQPNSNADVLLTVFERFGQMADEISSIPRYMMGNERVGGAGRTASGLAMLMGNAAKSLQNVAAQIDRDITKAMLHELYDMIMLTMPGIFRGDESIVVKGVNYAVKREQDRMRQLEFLQMTNNPTDIQIMGPLGRAGILRSVAGGLGLDGETVVPDEDTMREQMQQAQMQQAQQMQQAPGTSPNEAPQNARAPAEAARQPVEGEFTSGVSGRPGMRMGG